MTDDHRWIDTEEALDGLREELVGVERLALDTEFHRERTYFPRLALVQLGWSRSDRSTGIALVDPLRVDVGPLLRDLDVRATFVLHAAQQDLDVLAHAVDFTPSRLFDTQLAAGFCGYATPSLTNLVNGEIGRSLPKGDRLTDWLRRPLTPDQRSYAASDVAHLFELHDRISGRLIERDRLEWANEACEELRSRPHGRVDPAAAWQKMKDVRTMQPRTRGVLAAVAEWRERRAMTSDVPPRQVLPDLAVQGIAQRNPSTVAELAQARGVDERHTRNAIADEILAAVRRGRDLAVALPESDGDELERHLRPAVTLVSAWVSEVARREEIDTALVATRSDIVEYLRRGPAARLALGWRRTLVGNGLDDIVEGRAAIRFDGRGGLVLVDLSGTRDGSGSVGATSGTPNVPGAENAG